MAAFLSCQSNLIKHAAPGACSETVARRDAGDKPIWMYLRRVSEQAPGAACFGLVSVSEFVAIQNQNAARVQQCRDNDVGDCNPAQHRLALLGQAAIV